MITKEWPRRYTLRPWQLDFAQRYLEQSKPLSLLVAATGTGKTISSLYVAHILRVRNYSNSLIVLNDLADLREQWKQMSHEVGFNLSDTIDDYREEEHDGLSITVQSVNSEQRERRLLEFARNSNVFGIVDESHRNNKAINDIVDKLLQVNSNNRFLFISGAVRSVQDTFDAQFRLNTEYIFQDSIVKLPETKIAIARFSPSFSILQKILKSRTPIDDLNWREFEKLIFELLKQDGYEVELMQGTKDGGVDVVAVKDLGEAGYFKTLWQAKKYAPKNKIGLSVIRELADTRAELRASKGMIVTSTYLTRDALARVQRDRYILGKVDRDDLNDWIQRVLSGDTAHGPGY